MIRSSITIGGKKADIAYCYATEIIFNKNTGTSIDMFDAENPEHLVYLIIAALMSADEKPAITDHDIMYDARPKEIIDAVQAVFEARREWYELPAGDNADEKKSEEDSGKN